MLAGDVVGTYSNGVLELAGGSASEELTILIDPSSNSLTVTGINGTTINGLAEETYSSVTDLSVDLRRGDNQLFIASEKAQLAALHSLTVQTGTGNDLIVAERIRSDSNLITTRAGDDFVKLSHSYFVGLNLNTGSESDAVQIEQSQLEAGASITTGADNDVIDFRGNELVDIANPPPFLLATRAGDDFVNVVDTIKNGRTLIANGGSGSDSGEVDINSLRQGIESPTGGSYFGLDRLRQHPGFLTSVEMRSNLTHDVKLKDANGRVTITGTNFSDRIIVNSDAAGTKYIFTGLPGTTINGQQSLEVSTISRLDLNMRGGNDEVLIQRDIYDRREIGRVIADLGSGDDYFEILRQDVDGEIRVFGRDGNDLVDIHLADNNGVLIDLGEGDDTLDLFNSRIVGATRVYGRGGEDNIQFMYSEFVFQPVNIHAGTGRDYVFYYFNERVQVSSFNINGGAYADTLNAAEYSVTGTSFEFMESDWPTGRDQLELHQLQHLGILLPYIDTML